MKQSDTTDQYALNLLKEYKLQVINGENPSPKDYLNRYLSEKGGEIVDFRQVRRFVRGMDKRPMKIQGIRDLLKELSEYQEPTPPGLQERIEKRIFGKIHKKRQDIPTQ